MTDASLEHDHGSQIPTVPNIPCPICGQPYGWATASYENKSCTVITAYYCCRREHGWNLRWAVSA